MLFNCINLKCAFRTKPGKGVAIKPRLCLFIHDLLMQIFRNVNVRKCRPRMAYWQTARKNSNIFFKYWLLLLAVVLENKAQYE